jgi:signal recognition particle subunit SRP54
MVLAELGGKLRDSLRKLQTSASGQVTEQHVTTLLSEIPRALIESDVNVKLVMTLRDNVKSKIQPLLDQIKLDSSSGNDDGGGGGGPSEDQLHRHSVQLSKAVQKAVVEELVKLVSPQDKKPYVMKRGKKNVILFVGLQGAGKTTSIAKFANYYQRRGWKVAMVCADTFRAGAFDQLKQNATKLRIPFYGSYVQADPVQIAQDGVDQFKSEGYEVILVDTSGRHKQEAGLLEEMQEIAAAVHPDNTVLVMDATQGQSLYDQAMAFSSSVDVGSVLMTKLDGHAKGGGALSAVAATESPIVFLGSGEHFDDLDPFNAEGFVSKLLGFGDVRGLMDAMKDVGGADGKSQEELMEKMSKGVFTLRDMYSQFQRVMNMGPLNKVMGMMPGMPEYLVPKNGEDDSSANRLKKFLYMMDSMTAAELDGKVDFSLAITNSTTPGSGTTLAITNHSSGGGKGGTTITTKKDIESRIRRIAIGSGTHPKEVKMLLLVHRQFEGMVSKMGKSGLMGKDAQQKQQQMAAQMRKNPNMIQQRLNQMDPRLLQQMGGRDAVAAMMQQMAKGGAGAPGAGGMPGMGGAGGMPDMSALMGALGGGGGGMPPGMMPNMGGGGGGGMPPGMGGMDMETIMKMAQSMGGMPGMMGGGGAAGRR